MGGRRSPLLLPGPRWRLWLAGAAYGGCAVAFLADVTHDIPWAFGVFYLPLVCTAALYRDPRWVWWLAAGAIAMVLVGVELPVANPGLASIANGSLSIAAILITAGLVRLERAAQDRLILENQRALDAERLKMQFLASLGDGLRTPAETIVGLADSLMPGIRPEQRSMLERLRAAGQQLRRTIDNLLDLTAATDHEPRLEALDIAAIVRAATDAVRHNAAQKHVWLEDATDVGPRPAMGDAWALRRILDNLLDNALKFTPAGGHVRVGIEFTPGTVIVVVDDSGPGIAAATLSQLGQPFLPAGRDSNRAQGGLGTGLALCRKLADGMQAGLTFSSEPGQGTCVRLSLPVA